MKIENMTWKDKVWVTGLVAAMLFTLTMLSYEAFKDSTSYFGQMLFQQVNVTLK